MWRLFFVAALMAMAPAEAAEPGWITDTHGCKIWDSTPQENESVSWSGQCKNGFAEGKGTLIWLNGGQLVETYEGQLKRGHYQGRGVQIWRDGARFEGQYRSDRAHGWGTYRSAGGETYTGRWVKGCASGKKKLEIGTSTAGCR